MIDTIAKIVTTAVPTLLAVALALIIEDLIAEKIHHKKISKKLLEKALENECFAGEELIREADMLMHDETQSDEAIDFARRVYLIGRTAQEAKEHTEDDR